MQNMIGILPNNIFGVLIFAAICGIGFLLLRFVLSRIPKSIFIVSGAIALSYFINGNNLFDMIIMLIIFDLFFGIAVVVRGYQINDNGRIIGGALCVIMALGSVPQMNDSIQLALAMQVLGGVVGLSGSVVEGAGRAF